MEYAFAAMQWGVLCAPPQNYEKFWQAGYVLCRKKLEQSNLLCLLVAVLRRTVVVEFVYVC